MTTSGLAAVRDHVVASPEVAWRLAAIDDGDALFAAVVDLAETISAEVTRADLDAAVAESRRRNLERWL